LKCPCDCAVGGFRERATCGYVLMLLVRLVMIMVASKTCAHCAFVSSDCPANWSDELVLGTYVPV